MSHPFGDLLSQFLHRKHGLSQFKLADGIMQSPSVISEMCKGKRLTGPQARQRVVAILSWLHRQEALKTLEDANSLLEAAGMSPLREGEPTEAELLHKLKVSSVQNPQPSKENAMAELPTIQFNGKPPAGALPHNLPSQLTPLIGREGEIDEVIELLNKPECRLLTLTGQGGIGKTRLAIQVASQIRSKFPDGIFFTALQPAMEPTFLTQAILDAIGMPIYGTDDPRKQLVHFLHERKILLLLDNFEELLQTSPENAASSFDLLAEILHQALQVKLLVTSRVVLNLSGEWIYPVQGLAYPQSSLDNRSPFHTTEILTQFPAIQLFIERAKRVQPHFSTMDEMAGIVQICQVVEGLPLALEIAAAWTKMISCAAIAAEIQRSLVFLKTRHQDVPARHRSILAVINHSWQALSPEERQVYARLSVFTGGFQRQAAEHVAGASLPILSTLVDKSLLHWGPGDRYHFHELLRQFAHDQLHSDPQAARDAHALHCTYFADFLNERSAAITGPRQLEVLRSIAAELQNIRAAWRQAIADVNVVVLHKAAYTYSQFCDFTSHYLEGAEAFEQAISRLLESRTPAPQDPSAAEVLAQLYHLLGGLCVRLGKYELSEKALLTSQAILQAHGFTFRPGFGTDPNSMLSLLAMVKGDYIAAIHYGEAARDAGLLHDDPLNLQVACYMLASAAFSLGEFPRALDYINQGLYLIEITGNRWFKGQLLTVQGQIVQAQNQYPLAKRIFQEIYQIKLDMNDLEGEANALNHLAEVALLQGNPQEAQRLYQKSLEIILRINDPGGLGGTYAGLGASALANRDFTAACRYYTQGLHIALQIQWLPLTIALFTGISDLLLEAVRVEQSAALLRLVLAQPAITEDARIRASQRLERVVAQMPRQDHPRSFSKQAPEKLEEVVWHTARNLLVELNSFSLPNARIESGLERKTTLIQSDARQGDRQDIDDPLTAREMDVLRLIAQGKSNQQIADAFVLSVGTVKWYSQQIYQKLGVGNRTQAVARAREIHLLE
jgi:predicted ATPase/DNA-binding NarL/FixJ family response regulator